MARASLLPAAVVLLGVAPTVAASTYTVTNTHDTGTGSLRWAMNKANGHAGADTILFEPALSGQTITVASALPHLTDNSTEIYGDIDGNGKPEIRLDGPLGADGLVIEGGFCRVSGLAIAGLPHCITVRQTAWCWITSCHLGVTLTGNSWVRGTGTPVSVIGSNAIAIGGAKTEQRNVIVSGPSALDCCIRLTGCGGCLIQGNYIGLGANGSKVLGSPVRGVIVEGTAGLPAPTSANLIGGSATGAGNTFGGMWYAVDVKGVPNTRIQGNLFGLMADGDTVAPISVSAIRLMGGASNTRIGGTTAGARNVFAGSMRHAIDIREAGTDGNQIQGNYFGTNRAGTACRPLAEAVFVWSEAGPQTIGGRQVAAGNYFAVSRNGVPGEAITLAGPASAGIRHNVFGRLPSGGAAPSMDCGIMLYAGASANIEDNAFTHCAWYGIRAADATTGVSVYRNTFRSCYCAVCLTNAVGKLGNLGNAGTGDDGGNVFDDTDDWFIYNNNANAIKAEGNDFGTTLKAEIDARIFDNLDCPETGLVDYTPLAGGIMPTHHPSPASLRVTGAAALPTESGAEIAFSLSSPAEVSVTVLNAAGRPVATIVQDRAAQAGLQRVLWNGRSASGTRVPGGRYLVRVVAYAADGGQSSAMTTVPVR